MSTSPGTTSGQSCSPSFKVRTSDHKDHVRVEIEVFSSSDPTGGDFAALHQSVGFYLHDPKTMRKLAHDLANATQALRWMADKIEADTAPRADGLKPCGCQGGCLLVKPMGYTDVAFKNAGGGKVPDGCYCQLKAKG